MAAVKILVEHLSGDADSDVAGENLFSQQEMEPYLQDRDARLVVLESGLFNAKMSVHERQVFILDQHQPISPSCGCTAQPQLLTHSRPRKLVHATP